MTIQPNDTPAERLNTFFEFMWGDTEGIVYVATKEETGKWHKKYFPWPSFKSGATQYCLVESSNKDVYFGPAMYKNTPEVIEKLKKKQSITKEDILGSHVSWVEFDGNAPEEWTPDVSQDAGAPSQPLPEPSLRVQSSRPGHQHVYWRYKEFNTDVESIELVNRVAAYLTKADTSGWDINQVLRPIESKNHGNKATGKIDYGEHNQVFVFDQSNAEYPKSAFSHFEKPKEYITESIDVENLPDPLEILAKYVWTEDDTALIGKSREEINAADRSSALMRIGYTCAEMQLSDAEAYALLLFCDDKWEKFKHRGDRKRRLVEIINRARQRYPHGVKDPTFAGLQPDSGADQEFKPQLIYGFTELLESNVKIDWMVQDLIPSKGLAMIASAPGVGKTQFGLGLAMHCVLGKQMLLWNPLQAHKVLWAGLEMNLPATKHLLTSMVGAYTEEEQEILQRNFRIFPYGQAVNLMLKESRKGFESIIEAEQPQGIYIDSLQKIYLGDLSKDEIRTVYNYLVELREKYGCYIFLIHHDRKATEGNKRPRDLSDIYGSVYITAEPETVLHMWRRGTGLGQPIEIRELKNRYAPEKSLTVVRNQFLHYEQTDPMEEEQSRFNGLQPGTDGGSQSSFLDVG